MSSTFHKIIRKDLTEILENILPKEEVRMARLLLSNTSLDIKIKGVETESLQSKKVSSQGDSISGIFLNIYLGYQRLNTLRNLAYGKKLSMLTTPILRKE